MLAIGGHLLVVVEQLLQIGCIMLHNGEPVLMQIEITCGQIASEFYLFVPLSLVLNKLKRKKVPAQPSRITPVMHSAKTIKPFLTKIRVFKV